MPSYINRGTLPANFLDSVSSGMMIPEPEPQYFFARMAGGAQMRDTALAQNMSNAQHFLKFRGGGDAMSLMSSMNVSGHLVDVSPLSTLGALCLAAAPPGTDTRALFNKLLAWGLSRTVVGATVCWIVFR